MSPGYQVVDAVLLVIIVKLCGISLRCYLDDIWRLALGDIWRRMTEWLAQ
jgi:hypothetical protein